MNAISSSAVPTSALVASQRDPAAIEHDEAVGDVEDVVDVVADEQRSSARSPAPARTKWKTLAVSVSDSAVVGSSRTIRSAWL